MRDIGHLLSAETDGREQSLDLLAGWESAPCEVTGASARHAVRLGLIERLLSMGAEAVNVSSADQGSRFLVAEIAIDLASARELVFRADPTDPLQVALAGVATRDTLDDALTRVAKLALSEQWDEFLAIRSHAEEDLRQDPTGSRELEATAAAVIEGGRDLMAATQFDS